MLNETFLNNCFQYDFYLEVAFITENRFDPIRRIPIQNNLLIKLSETIFAFQTLLYFLLGSAFSQYIFVTASCRLSVTYKTHVLM